MRIIIDFCLYEKRDEIFISNRKLLAGFLAYLLNVLNSISNRHQPIAVTNHNRFLGDLQPAGFSVQYLPNTRMYNSYKSRILSLLDTALPGTATTEQLLIISPFKGVVTLNRINAMLNNSTMKTLESYSSMALLNSNQNPIRFHTIPKKNDTGKTATISPTSFLSSLNFISMVKKEYIQALSSYIDSQFAPEMHAIDEALIVTQACLLKDKKSKQPIPVIAPLDAQEDIPILYKLPIFNFSKNSRLSF